MEVAGIIGVVIGLIGFAFAVKFYLELYRWAKLCQGARIAVAYKGKVKLQAPVMEWALWCRMLENDKSSHGRVIFQHAGVSVAITKKVNPPGKIRQAVRRAKARRGSVTPQVQTGTWKATDETKKMADSSSASKTAS